MRSRLTFLAIKAPGVSDVVLPHVSVQPVGEVEEPGGIHSQQICSPHSIWSEDTNRFWVSVQNNFVLASLEKLQKKQGILTCPWKNCKKKRGILTCRPCWSRCPSSLRASRAWSTPQPETWQMKWKILPFFKHVFILTLQFQRHLLVWDVDHLHRSGTIAESTRCKRQSCSGKYFKQEAKVQTKTLKTKRWSYQRNPLWLLHCQVKLSSRDHRSNAEDTE